MRLAIRALYHYVVPGALRRGAGRVPLLGWLRSRFFVESTALHDVYYDWDFFNADYERWAQRHARHIVPLIVGQFRPSSVLDVGCGTGAFLEEFVRHGVNGRGVELASVAVAACHDRGLEVQQHDLTAPGKLPAVAEVVFCTEMAEHLAERFAETLVDKVTSAAKKVVVFTAAPPGQPGHHHVNCQPHSCWIDKFDQRGFEYEEELSHCWRQLSLDANMPVCFTRNLLVFSARNGGEEASDAK